LIRIVRATKKDAKDLQAIQKRAFKEDLIKYGDDEYNPANETLEKIEMKIEKFDYFAILNDTHIIGGIDIRRNKNNHYRLSRIYLEPEYHNQSIGTKVIHLIEAMFPDAIHWSLDTPHLNYKNQYFYEKLGYVRIGENKISDKLILIDYIKRV